MLYEFTRKSLIMFGLLGCLSFSNIVYGSGSQWNPAWGEVMGAGSNNVPPTRGMQTTQQSSDLSDRLITSRYSPQKNKQDMIVNCYIRDMNSNSFLNLSYQTYNDNPPSLHEVWNMLNIPLGYLELNFSKKNISYGPFRLEVYKKLQGSKWYKVYKII